MFVSIVFTDADNSLCNATEFLNGTFWRIMFQADCQHWQMLDFLVGCLMLEAAFPLLRDVLIG